MRLFLLALLCACQSSKLYTVRSHPKVSAIVVDGDGADWAEVALEKIPDVDASFSVQHDAENIYVLVVTNDARLGALMRRELLVSVAGANVPAISKVADEQHGISAIEIRVPFAVTTATHVPIEFQMRQPKKEDDDGNANSARFSGGGGRGGSMGGLAGGMGGGGGRRPPQAARPQEDRAPQEINLKVDVEIVR